MKILCDSELVSSRKEGKWIHYSLNREGGEEAVRLLLAKIENIDCTSEKIVLPAEMFIRGSTKTK